MVQLLLSKGRKEQQQQGLTSTTPIPLPSISFSLQKLVKNIGVSNLSIAKVKDVLSYAKVVPAINQVEVHPYFRNQELIDYCGKHGVHVTAYSSLGTPSSAGHLVKKSAPNPSHVRLLNLQAIYPCLFAFVATVSAQLHQFLSMAFSLSSTKFLSSWMSTAWRYAVSCPECEWCMH